jgi:hypothetical protein
MHEKWYVDTTWLSYIIKHVSQVANFDKITSILVDPFSIYYPTASISSLESYLDILYETGPPNTRHKVALLYSIACRCGRIKPSAAPNLWNSSVKVNIGIALMYKRNFLASFHPSRFKHLILDALAPFLYGENFEIFIVFVISMMKHGVSSDECKIFMDFTLDCIDWKTYRFHEKTLEMNHKYKKYMIYLHKLQIGYSELQGRIKDAKLVFTYLESILKTDKVLVPKPFQEELYSVVYHPDNFKKLICIDNSI